MSDHVRRVREALHAQAAGNLEPARSLIRDDARINVPEFLPVDLPSGFDGVVALVMEMTGRCDGGFRSDLIDAIGARSIVTTVNEVSATRDGHSISYNTVWTFRFDGDQIAEAWLHPSVSEQELVDFYGFRDDA
jgi:hypothetical protein